MESGLLSLYFCIDSFISAKLIKMNPMNFNWIPSDPYGKIWKLVYFLETQNPQNYAYFLLAEIRQTNQLRWKWKLFTKKTDHYPCQRNWGFSMDKYQAIDKINEICCFNFSS